MCVCHDTMQSLCKDMAYFQPAAATAHTLAKQAADSCQIAAKVADGKNYTCPVG